MVQNMSLGSYLFECILATHIKVYIVKMASKKAATAALDICTVRGKI